jgi:hypothetical protein
MEELPESEKIRDLCEQIGYLTADCVNLKGQRDYAIISRDKIINELRKALSHLLTELTLSIDNNDLAIDGKHMNIYLAWLKAEKIIEQYQ